jgi:hypothetical protein
MLDSYQGIALAMPQFDAELIAPLGASAFKIRLFRQAVRAAKNRNGDDLRRGDQSNGKGATSVVPLKP